MADRDEKQRFEMDLHPSIAKLARKMQAKIDRDEHKGEWRDYDPASFYSALLREVAELMDAVDEGDADPDEVYDEAADVANFAMLIADAHQGGMDD